MSDTLEYLTELRERGFVIALTDDGENLKINAPKNHLDPATRSELGNRKSEIIAFLHQATAVAEQSIPPIEPRHPDAPLQLSAAQERIWKLYRLDRDGTGLNIAVPWRLRGSLNIDVLEAALADVVSRHETLRCRFGGGNEPDASPISMTDDAAITVERYDTTSEPSTDEPVTVAQRMADAFANRPFDLTAEVARAAVIEIGPDDHLLLLVFHQIVFDWGAALPLIDDLATSYQRRLDGDEGRAEPPAIGYLDFAAWQQTWLTGDGPEPHKAYWSDQLDRPYRSLLLPGSSISVTPDASTATPLPFHLDFETGQGLAQLSRSAGATLYMTLLGAWQSLLAAYGQGDEAIVYSLLNLNRPELKELIGLFANPLPVRVDLDGDLTATGVIERVSAAALGAYSHQDLPLEEVMAHFTADPESTSGPFQALFIFQHQPTPTLRLGDAVGELLTVGAHAAGFDLRLFAEEADDGIRGWLEFDSGRCDPLAAERLLDQYTGLLSAMAKRPGAPMASLMPVTDADRAAAAAEETAPRTADASFVEPRNDRERELAALWSELFKREVGIDDNFFSLGGYSLQAVKMMADIEASTGRALPLATLFQAPTIRALADIIDRDGYKLSWTSLVPIKESGAKPPIFCVAALGDEIIQFGELADLLDDDQPFYALQQGLERTDEIRTSIPAMASHYLSEIRTVQPVGPYLITGYCFGALVAYEMAQQLDASGETYSLISIEGEAPGGIYTDKRSNTERLTTMAAVLIKGGPGNALRYAKKRIARLWQFGPWTRLRHILHRGFERTGLPVPETLKDVLQINAQAANEYANIIPRRDGDLLLLRAETTTPGFVYQEQLGWDRYVDGDIHTHWIPGDHEGIWKSPNVQVFAKKLEQVIDESRSGLGAGPDAHS